MAEQTVTDNSSTTEWQSAIETLAQEVRMLRIAVDEFRDDLAWEMRKWREGNSEWKPYQLTSFPADATAADFHERVNTAGQVSSGREGRDVETPLTQFILQLTSEPVEEALCFDDWGDLDDFPPGESIQVDRETFDWFHKHPFHLLSEGDWFLIDDRADWFYLLWQWEEQFYLRVLTDAEQAEISRLTGRQPMNNPPEDSFPAQPTTTAAATEFVPPPAHQQTLW